MSGTVLKLIAILAMLSDHIGSVFFPEIICFRLIGRLALPIFVFLLTEGFTKSSNKIKYAQRLFSFGVISIVPYSLAFFNKWFCLERQNVLFTLFITLIMLLLFDKIKISNYSKIIKCIVFLGVVTLGIMLNFSYAVLCPLLAMVFCEFSNKKTLLIFGVITSIIIGYTIECYFVYNVYNWYLAIIMSIVELIGIAALIPIFFYNGKKGNLFPKYFFYLFYPVHLMVIYFVRIYIN